MNAQRLLVAVLAALTLAWRAPPAVRALFRGGEPVRAVLRGGPVKLTQQLDDGTPIAFTKRGTHWGGTDQFARVMQLRPLEQLPAGRASTVTWNFNGPLINGEVSTASVVLPVQTTCSEGSGACPIGCEARTGITSPEEVGTALGRPASCLPAEEGSGSGSGAEGAATENKKGDGGGCQTSRPSSAWSALWFAAALLVLRSVRSARRDEDAAAKG